MSLPDGLYALLSRLCQGPLCLKASSQARKDVSFSEGLALPEKLSLEPKHSHKRLGVIGMPL